MRMILRTIPIALFATAALAQGCGEPPVDSSRSDRRLFPVAGVIQGTVSYTGPHPCSRNGHIVGAAAILVFDRRNPPPPGGLAPTAVNFVAVTGDTLFANEPRNPGPNTYCPQDNGNKEIINASAPYTIAPMDPGSYVIQAFYDYTGTFFPTLKIRQLPEKGDVLGGYFDLADAAKHAGDINYQPKFLPVDVGNPLPTATPDAIPEFVLPDNGFVRDNVPVTIAAPAVLTRPYFYPQNPGHPTDMDPVNPADFADSADKPGTMAHPGSKETDPNYMPILTMTQDWQVAGQPTLITQDFVDAQQATFAAVRVQAGVPAKELPTAIAQPDYSKPPPYPPFAWQLPPDPAQQSLFVWDSGQKIPETRLVPQLYPLAVFAKLADDFPGTPAHSRDPQSVAAQGSLIKPNIEPAVIIQGLTLYKDSLFATSGLSSEGAVPASPADPNAKADHVTVLVRPSVICFNPAAFDQGGLLVTPHKTGVNPANGSTEDVIDVNAVVNAANGPVAPSRRLIRDYRYACLPKGRYAVNLVYPTGQAWTTPNEAGSCSQPEGQTLFDQLSCSNKPRPLLYSQGPRAVIEIVDAKDPNACSAAPSPDNPHMESRAVPVECLPCTPGADWGEFGKCPD